MGALKYESGLNMLIKGAGPSRIGRLAITLADTLIAVSVLIFALYAAHAWFGVRAEKIGQMDAIASLMKRTLDNYLVSKQAGLQSLVDTLDDTGGLRDLPKAQRLLSAYKSHREEINQTSISDLDGQVLVSSLTTDLQGLPFVGDQPAFKAFLQEYSSGPHLYVGRPQLGALQATWNISLRVFLTNKDGKPVAVLSDVIRSETLASFWSDAVSGSSISVGVLRDDGYLLGRYPVPTSVNLAEVYGKPRNGALAQHLQSAHHPTQGVVEGVNTIAGGENYLNCYRRLDKFPLTVFAAQPVAQMQIVWLYSLVPALIVLLLIGVAAKLAAWRVVSLEAQMIRQRLESEANLRRSEEVHRFLVDRLMTGLVVHDQAGVVIRCNLRATELLGLSLEQMTGKALIDPSWRFLRADASIMPIAEYPVALVLSTREPVIDYLVGVMKPDTPKVTWLLCRADPWFDDWTQLTKIVVTFADITSRRDLEVTVKDKDERFKALFENSMDAVLMTVTDGRILAVNMAGCALFGKSEAEIIAGGRSGLVDMTDPRLPELISRRSKNKSAIGLLTMKRGDGSHFTAEISSSVYSSSSGDEYSSMVVRDITERLQSQQKLESAYAEMRKVNETLDEMAHFDALTHLPNRALLADRLQQAISHAARREKSVGIAFLDLDGFKEINDKYGHAIGDKLLISIATRLRSTLREGDTLSRFGGDEFVAVLTDLTDQGDLEPSLKRLLAVASECIVIEEITLQVSASIGVTTFPQDGSSPEQLLRHADQAMYSAKQAGKNRIHWFDVASDTAVRTHRERLEHVVDGMQQQRFVLFYQPQVNMRSGEVVGMEALIRWNRPSQGVLGPAQFLPAIEDDPLAMAFGDMVLDLAMQQLSAWQQAGHRFKLSVNLFNQQIQDPEFPARLKSMMDRYPELLPDSLKLEIVETHALTDIAMVSSHMRQCIVMGVNFAVDDFGTGYSSLTYLKKLPAQQLKIDQTFVRDMLTNREDMAIVQGVVSLASAFDRDVIAEGVETVEQARTLVQLGCKYAQGFGIAMPMPANVLDAWLREWTHRQPWV